MTLDQLFDRAMPIPESGCWAWMGYVTNKGYGKTTVARRPRWAHRAAYEAAKGPIPEGMQIDHLCRVRCCINPDHLEAVTPRENVVRGIAVTKTHCGKGHPYTPENTGILTKNGNKWRFCRVCRREMGQRGSSPRLRKLRAKFGVSCPVCKIDRPKFFASILLPGQDCRWDGYIDPRTPLPPETKP